MLPDLRNSRNFSSTDDSRYTVSHNFDWLPLGDDVTVIHMYFITTGLQADAGKFFLFMLAIFAQNLAISGILYAVAALIGVFAAAQTLANLIIVFAMVC